MSEVLFIIDDMNLIIFILGILAHPAFPDEK